ncbi:phosphatase PAP2 family protein [Virgibacillus soli]|uniref:Phosphatase PAP2 family protein n=1 Tax=Paracerasibacillus soli TaxID=480284 RepID=A0ABU5CV63_9BACI|nr:phosphatase PAP2 family protein [Virgibacillus soli]MDY0410269.1 phosphatase PAP2 family protein [Virgibacillus soli]
MQRNRINTFPLFIIGFICLALFGWIAWGVTNNSKWIETFDIRVIDFVQSYISDFLTSIVKITTELGNIRLIIIFTIIIAAALFVKRKFANGLWFGGTILFCGVILTKILKKLFDRDRPQFLQLVEKTNESFPSGHATGTTIFYGFIGLVLVLAATHMGKKILISMITLLWILYIMATRIYLGVHFPTDVLSGFFLGMASVFISIAVYVHAQEPLHHFLRKLKLDDRSVVHERQRYY